MKVKTALRYANLLDHPTAHRARRARRYAMDPAELAEECSAGSRR